MWIDMCRKLSNINLIVVYGYLEGLLIDFFFFSSRRRHTRYWRDWSSDVCSSDLPATCVRPRHYWTSCRLEVCLLAPHPTARPAAARRAVPPGAGYALPEDRFQPC